MGVGDSRHELTDLYELLEVSPGASQEVIRAAYRALARETHPDVRSGTGEGDGAEADRRMRQLNAAYRVLGHTERRARYDLECARLRRLKRTVALDRHLSRVDTDRAVRLHALPAKVTVHRIDDSVPLLSAGALLLMMTVVAVTAFLVVVVWISQDAPRDDANLYDRPLVELSTR